MQHRERLSPDDSVLQVSDVFGGEFDQPWAPALTAVGSRMESLELPSLFLSSTLSAACMAVPDLRDLVIHVGWHSEMGCLLSVRDDDVDSAFAWLAHSQLRSLTFCVPPGHPPFHLIGGDEDLVYLSDLPLLQALVLRGPIVKQDCGDGVPFDLLPHAKVRWAQKCDL